MLDFPKDMRIDITLTDGRKATVINFTPLDSQIMHDITRVALDRAELPPYENGDLGITYLYRSSPFDPNTAGSFSDESGHITVYIPKALRGENVLSTLYHEISHFIDWVNGVEYDSDIPYDERPEEIRARRYASKMAVEFYWARNKDAELAAVYNTYSEAVYNWACTPWGFVDWLSLEVARDDMVSDLARDLNYAIQRGDQIPTNTRRAAWVAYLEGQNACPGAFEALDKAFDEWRAINKRVYSFRAQTGWNRD